jgi:hypothetical protein
VDRSSDPAGRKFESEDSSRLALVLRNRGIELTARSNIVQSIEVATGGAKMEGPLRGLLAGAAAWKFGGGCISTILIFIIVFWLLGYVNC